MRLLLVVAHPDDETFGCGSVLAHATAAGIESVVLCATRGELGEVAGLGRDEIGVRRESELRAATAELGVCRVEVLGWRDSGVEGDAEPGSLVAAPTSDVAAVIAGYLDELQPEIVIVPEGSDGHRDHLAVRDATLAALGLTEWQPERIYLWCLVRSLLTEFAGFELGTPDDTITTVVDVSKYLEQRDQAMRAHASQLPPYDLMTPELRRAFLATDYLIRLHPPFTDVEPERDWIPADVR